MKHFGIFPEHISTSGVEREQKREAENERKRKGKKEGKREGERENSVGCSDLPGEALTFLSVFAVCHD